ncbi:hypothetical protein SNEBB_008357 [Seison nebaliae]|nr:hypothetical protein SNEBB_008357 [Seison nebaliae]
MVVHDRFYSGEEFPPSDGMETSVSGKERLSMINLVEMMQQNEKRNKSIKFIENSIKKDQELESPKPSSSRNINKFKPFNRNKRKSLQFLEKMQSRCIALQTNAHTNQSTCHKNLLTVIDHDEVLLTKDLHDSTYQLKNIFVKIYEPLAKKSMENEEEELKKFQSIIETEEEEAVKFYDSEQVYNTEKVPGSLLLTTSALYWITKDNDRKKYYTRLRIDLLNLFMIETKNGKLEITEQGKIKHIFEAVNVNLPFLNIFYLLLKRIEHFTTINDDHKSETSGISEDDILLSDTENELEIVNDERMKSLDTVALDEEYNLSSSKLFQKVYEQMTVYHHIFQGTGRKLESISKWDEDGLNDQLKFFERKNYMKSRQIESSMKIATPFLSKTVTTNEIHLLYKGLSVDKKKIYIIDMEANSSGAMYSDKFITMVRIVIEDKKDENCKLHVSYSIKFLESFMAQSIVLSKINKELQYFYQIMSDEILVICNMKKMDSGKSSSKRNASKDKLSETSSIQATNIIPKKNNLIDELMDFYRNPQNTNILLSISILLQIILLFIIITSKLFNITSSIFNAII